MNHNKESRPRKFKQTSNQIEKDLYKEFKFYLCPEETCEDRNNAKENFANHVVEKHPATRLFISSIISVSYLVSFSTILHTKEVQELDIYDFEMSLLAVFIKIW